MRALLLAALAAVGCSDLTSPRGDVAVALNGESFVEHGIPATSFTDGWSITFTRFVVTVHDVGFGAERMSERTLDLVKGSQRLTTFSNVPTGRYDDFHYTVAALVLEGVARNGAAEKRFAWTYDTPTTYVDCLLHETSVVVRDNALEQVEITIHADHLFHDAHDEALRFEAIALADRDGDGAITRDELRAVRLASIPDALGPYRVGAASVDTLDGFLEARTRTLGHFRGEGECRAK